MNSYTKKNRHYSSTVNEQKNGYQSTTSNTDSNIRFTETEEGYHLEMKIAGYIKDDFNFYIDNNDLILTTEKSEGIHLNSKGSDNLKKHSYCYASAFLRKTFHLPKAIEKNKIFVDYKNQILSIDLLKLNSN